MVHAAFLERACRFKLCISGEGGAPATTLRQSRPIKPTYRRLIQVPSRPPLNGRCPWAKMLSYSDFGAPLSPMVQCPLEVSCERASMSLP
eukprot:15446015-Alexandrium_andersonii.AAC.2